MIPAESTVFGMPLALVSLIDTDRQWFNSEVGLEATQTPRSESFCAHALNLSAPLVVSDASALRSQALRPKSRAVNHALWVTLQLHEPTSRGAAVRDGVLSSSPEW
jgi:hypothetical protein